MFKTNRHRVQPTYREMIHTAIKVYKRRGGSSRQEIFKYITTYYKLKEQVTYVRYYLNIALKAGVQDGSLKQIRGTGVNGFFRIGKTPKPNEAKIVQSKKQTTGEKSLLASTSSNGLQNMPPQQLESETLDVPKTRNSKAGDLQSAHSHNNVCSEISLHKVNLSENSITHNDSITGVNLPNSFSTPDPGIGNLPANCIINNVNSLETLTSPAALRDIVLPKNTNAVVSVNNAKLKPSKKYYSKKTKQKDVSKPLIPTVHPIIPEYALSRKNCKFCYATLGIERKCSTKCFTCERHLCFNIKRNCLLEFHKIN